MSELEIYLMSSLQNIVDLHNLPNDTPCKCMQCKIARQAIKHAQLRVKHEGYKSLGDWLEAQAMAQPTKREPDLKLRAEKI